MLRTHSGFARIGTAGTAAAVHGAWRCLLAVLLVGVPAAVTGCNATGEARFEVPAGRYEAAFDATREVLREYQFELARVDSVEGVIASAPRASSGLATPWDRDQTTVSQEVDDLLNRHERAIRVEFAPVPEGMGQATAGTVRATIYRLQSPGVRPASRAIGSTTTTVDPLLLERGVWAGQLVPWREDPELAVRLARRIEAVMAKVTEAPPEAVRTP